MSSSSLSRLLLLPRSFSSIRTPTIPNGSKSNSQSNPKPESTSSHSQARTAIALLKSEKDPTRILSICTSMLSSSSSPSHLHLSALSLAVSSLSSATSVRSLLSSLPLPLPPHHLITLFGHARLLDDALSAFTNTPNNKKDTRSLNALLFACILSGNPRQAPLFFRDLPARHRIVPDLATYNTLLKSFSLSGSSLSAFSLFDEMSRTGIRPNLTSFSIALSGLYCEQRFDHVERLLVLMKKHGCRPGLSIYNVRIQSLCKLKRVEEAKRILFKEMRLKRMKPNCATYGHLILGFCSVGDLDEALRLYREMGRRGLVPESSCYFTLIHYLCKGREFESALEVCRESMERNWVPCFAIMRGLVDGLVSISKVDEARELVNKMNDKFPGSVHMWEDVEPNNVCRR